MQLFGFLDGDGGKNLSRDEIALLVGGDEAKADKTYQGMTPLVGADVASVVRWVAEQPAHMNIAEVLVFPSDQASATVVHRR